MNAILFPGQGSQIPGMGKDFYNNFEIVKKIFKEADEKLNYKISKIILEGPEDKLKLRNKLDLNKNDKTVLLMGGGDGVGGLKQIAIEHVYFSKYVATDLNLYTHEQITSFEKWLMSGDMDIYSC